MLSLLLSVRSDVPEVTMTSSSLAQTKALAQRLALSLSAGVGEDGWGLPPAPLALLLRGEVGAGTTTFTQSFVAALPGGAGLVVQSPTFALARSYATTPPVHHLDLYRLYESGGAARDVVDLGLMDLVDDGVAVSIIEWSPAGVVWPLVVRELSIEILSARKRRFVLRSFD